MCRGGIQTGGFHRFESGERPSSRGYSRWLKRGKWAQQNQGSADEIRELEKELVERKRGQMGWLGLDRLVEAVLDLRLESVEFDPDLVGDAIADC